MEDLLSMANFTEQVAEFLICLDINSAPEMTSRVHCFLAWVNTMVIWRNFKALAVRFMRHYVPQYIAEW